MTLEQAIEILKAHNNYYAGKPPYRWREMQGDNVPQAIEILINEIEKCKQLI